MIVDCGAGFVVPVVSVVVVVAIVVSLVFLSPCPLQETIQIVTMANKIVERKVEGFIVLGLKMNYKRAEEVCKG